MTACLCVAGGKHCAARYVHACVLACVCVYVCVCVCTAGCPGTMRPSVPARVCKQVNAHRHSLAPCMAFALAAHQLQGASAWQRRGVPCFILGFTSACWLMYGLRTFLLACALVAKTPAELCTLRRLQKQ